MLLLHILTEYCIMVFDWPCELSISLFENQPSTAGGPHSDLCQGWQGPNQGRPGEQPLAGTGGYLLGPGRFYALSEPVVRGYLMRQGFGWCW